jgi:hypothetical protein
VVTASALQTFAANSDLRIYAPPPPRCLWNILNLTKIYDSGLPTKDLRIFRHVRKSTKSDYSFHHVCLSVRTSVRPHGTIRPPLDGFSRNLGLSIFRKSVEKVQVSLESEKNNGYFTWNPTHIYDNTSMNSWQNEKCFRQNSQRKSKHIFTFNNFFSQNRAVYEIMWKNMVQLGMPQTTI